MTFEEIIAGLTKKLTKKDGVYCLSDKQLAEMVKEVAFCSVMDKKYFEAIERQQEIENWNKI